MKKVLPIVTLAFALILAASCTGAPPVAETEAPASEPVTETEAPLDIPEKSPAAEETGPAPEPTPTPAPEKPKWQEQYLEFLDTGFDKLQESFLGGVAGIGFVDLDLDGVPEMVLFDLGASASMGVQFFDIIGGSVECVSANMQTVGDAFGGAHYSSVYVNCNYFSDFRLMENKAGGKLFCVKSGNGANDFSYQELISFYAAGDILGLKSELYKYTEYNEEGEEVASRYDTAGTDCTLEEYIVKFDGFFADNKDLGYEARGVFFWEDSSYGQDYDGVMSMAKSAASFYVPIQ